MVLPILYSLAKTGKIHSWEVSVFKDEILVRHGQVDGKKQYVRTKAEPKNIGKINETTAEEQALKEAQSIWLAQKDKGYRECIDDIYVAKIAMPMLAQEFEKHSKKIKYPVFVQPKLNGVRCLIEIEANGHIHYWSRKQKDYASVISSVFNSKIDINALKKVVPEFAKGKQSFFIDGELFHPDYNFSEIVSAVKKYSALTEKLQIWYYDVPAFNTQEIAFIHRKELMELLHKAAVLKESHFIKVSTVIAENENVVYNWHDVFTKKLEFEGVIIRNLTGVYGFGKRTKDLLKYKSFKEEEFTIEGYSEGVGTTAGCIIFKVSNPAGKDGRNSFSVTPKFSLEKRREMLLNAEAFIGKQLTVKYQEKSIFNVPVFPVGIAIRDYE